jgi:hypothetical protein
VKVAVRVGCAKVAEKAAERVAIAHTPLDSVRVVVVDARVPVASGNEIVGINPIKKRGVREELDALSGLRWCVNTRHGEGPLATTDGRSTPAPRRLDVLAFQDECLRSRAAVPARVQNRHPSCRVAVRAGCSDDPAIYACDTQPFFTQLINSSCVCDPSLLQAKHLDLTVVVEQL